MNDILKIQLAADYCCEMQHVADGENHFTVWQPLDGRRRFDENDDCALKIAVVGGKLLFTGRTDIIEECRIRFGNATGEWFFEAENLLAIEQLIRPYGYRISQAHPFFAAYEASPVPYHEFETVIYDRNGINAFRGDERFSEAFAFQPDAPDEIGIAAVYNGNIIGMAGASGDSPYMWQIGINVLPEARGHGIAGTLVTMLKNCVLERGKVAFYGTAMSHIASQRVALASGFRPEWAELVTKHI